MLHDKLSSVPTPTLYARLMKEIQIFRFKFGKTFLNNYAIMYLITFSLVVVCRSFSPFSMTPNFHDFLFVLNFRNFSHEIVVEYITFN